MYKLPTHTLYLIVPTRFQHATPSRDLIDYRVLRTEYSVLSAETLITLGLRRIQDIRGYEYSVYLDFSS